MTCRRDSEVCNSNVPTSLSKQESSNFFRILSTGTPDIEVSKNSKKWGSGGFIVHFHFLTRFSLSSSLIIINFPSSHLDLLFFCLDISANEKCRDACPESDFMQKSHSMRSCMIGDRPYINVFWRFWGRSGGEIGRGIMIEA
jgi:hypothetical protein